MFSATNLQRKQQFEQRQEALQDECNLTSDKLKQLEWALQIESGSAVKFQLETQIQELKKHLQELKKQIQDEQKKLQNEQKQIQDEQKQLRQLENDLDEIERGLSRN